MKKISTLISSKSAKIKGALVLVLLLASTNIITYKLAFSRGASEWFVQNPYPLIDNARNYIPQEHFIVNIQPLRVELRELVEKNSNFQISLYFEYLSTGANISINPDLKIWPASLAKLPLAMAVMNKVDDGTWELTNELVLMGEDKDPGSGELYKKATGTRFTIEYLLRELLRHSDNTAYQILLRNMSLEDLQPIVDETGLEELIDEEGKISAKEYARMFRALYTSSFLKRANTTKLLEWLSETDYDKFLASGLPADVPFANKWGINKTVSAYSDSGIVYIPNRAYTLTVMVQADGMPDEEEKVQALMKDISQKVYQYVSTYKN